MEKQFNYDGERALFRRPERNTLPIVYHPDYNVTLMGLERYHPFDAQKFGRVYAEVVKYLIKREEEEAESENKKHKLKRTESKRTARARARFTRPLAGVPQEYLDTLHSAEYLEALTWSKISSGKMDLTSSFPL